MHEYRRFVQREMNARGWNQNDVAKYAGLNRQTIHSIVKDQREQLSQLPDARTIDGLANAFSVSRETVLAHVALAMGLPVKLERADVTEVSNDELVMELARRLKAGEDDASTPLTRAGVRPATDEQTLAVDFITGKQRLRADPAPDDEGFDEFIEQQAAKRGPNRGKQAKREQDDDAEQ